MYSHVHGIGLNMQYGTSQRSPIDAHFQIWKLLLARMCILMVPQVYMVVAGFCPELSDAVAF